MEDGDRKHIEIVNDIFRDKSRFIRFAWSYVADYDTAEDIVMDSFVYFWEHRFGLDTGGNLSAYLLTIVKHKCLDFLRHRQIGQKVRTEMEDDAQWELNMRIATLEAFDPYRIFDSEFQEAVRTALSKLPARTKRIFCMSRIDNKSYREIAEDVGMSQKTVEFHMSKALKILRKELKDFFVLFLLFGDLYIGAIADASADCMSVV